jgi:hypothetical protein
MLILNKVNETSPEIITSNEALAEFWNKFDGGGSFYIELD